jgi:hypothetical protein
MGLTLPQTYRYVLLPMAFRIILPPLSSEFLNIIRIPRWPDHRPHRTHCGGALDVGIFLPGVRGLHRRDLITSSSTSSSSPACAGTERRVAVPGFIGMSPPAAAH